MTASWRQARTGWLALIALLLSAPGAQARGDGDLWVMVVGPMCLAQFPEYAESETGQLFLRGADIQAFSERPFAQCFKTHQWASARLCSEVMGLRKEQWRDLQTVYEHHRDEIRSMKEAFDYFNGYITTDPRSRAWPPPCPEALK